MIRRFVFLTSLLVLFIAIDAKAQCDCINEPTPYNRGSRFSTAYDEFLDADLVFYGQVIAVRKVSKLAFKSSESNYEAEVFFSVEKAWKKDVPEILRIRQSVDGCTHGFDIGHRWLFYGYYDKAGFLRTGYCSRSRTADRKPELDMDAFRERGVKESKTKKTQESIVIDLSGR